MSNVSISQINCFNYANQESITEAVYKAIVLLGYDMDNYGTSVWNPFKASGLIKPGMNVLIKPNMVLDHNLKKSEGTSCLYTQAAIIKPIVELVYRALSGKGKVIIGDAPMQECNFKALVADGYSDIVVEYRNKGLDINIVDFRDLKSISIGGIHKAKITKESSGIPVSLNNKSLFYGLDKERLEKIRITNYPPEELLKHHNSQIHEYYISKYVLNADVIISVPKPKTHRKAGFTASLKNFVGINARKEYLPHHTMGAKQDGGDEYLDKNSLHELRSKIVDIKNTYESNHNYFLARVCGGGMKILSMFLRRQGELYWEGSWYGNDTIFRTIVDLNRIAQYVDKKGELKETPQRKIFVIADMIISGDHEGPVAPTAKNVGIIVAGTNLVCVDEVICTIMGFSIRKSKVLTNARKLKTLSLVDKDDFPYILSNNVNFNHKRLEELDKKYLFNFIPSSGWKGFIEL